MSILVCDLCGKGHNVQDCKIFFDNGKSIDPGSSQLQISLAYQTLPNWVFMDENQSRLIACKEIDLSFKIGPFLAPQSSILKDNIAFPLYLDLPNNIKLWLDQSDGSKCNWLSLIPPSLHNYNMVACQVCDNIYFVVVKPIKIGQDLKVWYAPFYKLKMPGEILDHVTLSLKGDKTADENGEVDVTSLINFSVKATDDNGSLYCQPSLFNDTQLLESHYIPNSHITGHESINIQHPPKVLITPSTVPSTFTSTSMLPLNSSIHSLFVVPMTHSNTLTPITSAFGESYLYNSLPSFPLNIKVNEIIPVTSQNFTAEENILQVLPTHNSLAASSENIVTLESQGNILNFSKACAGKIKKTSDIHARNHFNLHSLQQITVSDNKITFIHKFSKSDMDKSNYSPAKVEQQKSLSPKSNYVDIKDKHQTKTIIVKMMEDGVRIKKHSPKLSSNRSDICLVPHGDEIQFNFGYDMISLSITKDNSHPLSEALGYKILKKQKALEIPDKKSQYDVTSSRPPSLPNYWTCSFCQDTFTDKPSFAFHLKNHLQIRLGHRFACSACKLQFKNQDHLKAHLKSCSSTKPQKGTLLPQNSGSEAKNTHSIQTTKEQPSPIGVNGICYPGFVCEICLKRFNNLKYLLRHYSKHCGEFVCSLCKKEFARKENLRKHLCVQQSRMSGLRCDICRKTFSSLHLHKLHLKQHQEKVNCERCGQIFLNENSLTKHEKSCCPANAQELQSSEPSRAPHKDRNAGGVENSRFCCHVCSRSFSSYFFLKNHATLCEKLADASEKGAVNCEICGTVCAGASELRTHVQIHTHPYHCLSCSQRFRARGTYELHICLVPFSCDRCDSSLRSLRDLYKHVTPHGPPPLCCSRCRYPFYKMESLKHHRCQVEVSEATSESSERKRICCPCCPALFRSEYSVKKHMASLHGTPIKPFVCRKCGKTFHRSDLLRSHEKTHMAPSLQCSQCHKKFKSQRSLSNHASLHTKAFRFTCRHCHKGFSQKKDASRHEKTHVSPLSTPRPRPCFKCSECHASFQTNDQLRVHLTAHNSRTLAHTTPHSGKCSDT